MGDEVPVVEDVRLVRNSSGLLDVVSRSVVVGPHICALSWTLRLWNSA